MRPWFLLFGTEILDKGRIFLVFAFGFIGLRHRHPRFAV
jgi:hypothetical protein